MKTCLRLVAVLVLIGSAAYADVPEINREPVPPEQRAREVADMKWGMFICWSFSTFSGREWTGGVEDIAFFRAATVDTDQWARTASEAGMGYILFLTKHHDGFCLWDTRTTDRKVTNAPLGRDVLAELRQSCDKYGIKLALYFSEGDWTWPGARDGGGGKDGGGVHPEMKKAQLEELLTGYGPIEYIWFDHATGDGGLNHADTVAWCKQFQPNCLIGFNHGERAGDIQLGEHGRPGPVGQKTGVGTDSGDSGYEDYLVAEFTYPILPKGPMRQGGADWFYSLPEHDDKVLPAEKLYQDYLGAVKYGNIFSINAGPNYEGRLRDIDVQTLQQVGRWIRGEEPPPERIKAFCVDFNWGPEGFAPPGMYAHAKVQDHFNWYRDMGVNTIQTFCVSCPGYAWYNSNVAPVQPGMQGEFLKELAVLGHAADMRVMGYFCIGANTHWNEAHPELSHNFPSAISIPFTLAYLDYLEQVITESVSTTGIDGFMIDWVYNASHLYPDREYTWLECEKEMYRELFDMPFPGDDAMDAERINEFNKRATERCWDRIHRAAKSANPECIIWLTCYDLEHPMLKDSRMLREVDWLMNEHPDPEKLAATRALVGKDTRIIQCICGWGDQHNAEKILSDPQYADLGLYGFARPDLTTTLPPDDDSGNARNIAAMRTAFTGE